MWACACLRAFIVGQAAPHDLGNIPCACGSGSLLSGSLLSTERHVTGVLQAAFHRQTIRQAYLKSALNASVSGLFLLEVVLQGSFLSEVVV